MIIDNLYVDALINATNAYEAAWAPNGSGANTTNETVVENIDRLFDDLVIAEKNIIKHIIEKYKCEQTQVFNNKRNGII